MAWAIHLSKFHPLRSESSVTAVQQHLPRNSSFLYQNAPLFKKKKKKKNRNKQKNPPKYTTSPLTIFQALGYFAVQSTEEVSGLSTAPTAEGGVWQHISDPRTTGTSLRLGNSKPSSSDGLVCYSLWCISMGFVSAFSAFLSQRLLLSRTFAKVWATGTAGWKLPII